MASVKFLGDRLTPNHGLHPNEGIKSKNGRVQVILQPDGNYVLYGDNRPLWWTGIRPGVNSALMQTDGNFVLYVGGGRPGAQAVWASDTSGNPGAFLLAQDDGNLVVYAGSRALWSSQTNGFRYYGGPGKPSVISQAVSAVESIPVVGDAVHLAGEVYTAPFHFAAAVASGERLDQAIIGQLKEQLQIIKDVAPYAQMVVSVVPGLGTGVAMALGAGIALAEGQSITDAEKAAIRGAIPGGALVQAGFDVALKVASGENVGKAALEAARSQLPATAQKAFDIGLAVATGEKIQTALAKGLASFAPGQLQTVLAAGEKALAATPGLSDALKLVPIGEATEGFKLAAGLLSHAGLNEKALTAVRDQLPAAVRQGFDTALKTQEGRIAWLKNVASAPVQAPTTPSPTAVALQQLAKLTPDQRKLLQLSKLTPEQQRQLVAAASKAAPSVAAKRPPVVHEAPLRVPSQAQAKAEPSRPLLHEKAALPAPKLVVHAATPAVAAVVAGRYAPYPPGSGRLSGPPPAYAAYLGGGTLGAWGDTKRWFFWYVYHDGKQTSSGPTQMTDSEAFHYEDHTHRQALGVKMYRFVWPGRDPWIYDTRSPPKLLAGEPIASGVADDVLSAPPHGWHGGHGGHGGHGRGHGRPFIRGRGVPDWWWDVPWSPEVVTTTETCRTWGDPITMPPAMETAARSALGASKGRPSAVRGPDNVLYLFAFESGVMTARPCAAVAVA